MMNPADGAVEALLRKHFDGPVPDGGFSDAVMRRLPPRRRRVAWPLWAGSATGVVACWLGLSRASLLLAGWHDWMRGDISMPAVAMLLAVAGMALLATWWALAEAEG